MATCGLCTQPVGTNGGVSTYFKCHAFCKQCRKQWAKVSKACPICKQRQRRKRTREPEEPAANPLFKGYEDDGWLVADAEEEEPDVDWNELCGAKIDPKELEALTGGGAASGGGASAASSGASSAVGSPEVIDLCDDSDDEDEVLADSF